MGNSSLVDVVDANDQNSVKTLIKDLEEAVAQPTAGPAGKAQPKPADRPSYIEEKYWTGDIESSLQKQYEGFKSLQSQYGKVANDLGVQRQLTDQLIGLKRDADLRGQETPQPKPLPKLTASQLLERPDAALEELLNAREERLRSQYESRLAQLESQLTGVTLQAKHSDYADLVNDANWHEFLNSDPVRQREAQYAAQGDTLIADKLIREYKSTKAPKAPETPAPHVEQGDRVDEASKHALASAAAGDGKQGKIYSRSALMRLKLTDPDAYESPAFQSEILKAYQEGRVR